MDRSQRRIATRSRLLLVLVATGVAAGLGGIAVTYLLRAAQRVAFGGPGGRGELGADHAGALHRVVALLVTGLVGGVGWWLLRRRRPVVGVKAAVDGAPMPVVQTWLNAALQVVVVGGGASLGREAAPREVASAAAGWLAGRGGLSAPQRRLVIGCGAGAGLAAVYNVPVSGVAFALEVALGTVAPSVVAAAALVCGIATLEADLVLGDQPTYAVGPIHSGPLLLLTALVIGPVAGAVGMAFRQLTQARSAPLGDTPAGPRLIPALVLTFALVGAVAIRYPDVVGNGKTPAQLVFTGALSLPTLAVLLVAKPVLTAACLRAGAVGGLLTPSVATGALLGGLTGGLIHQVAPGEPVMTVAIAAAAAVLSVTLRAPCTACVLLIEFTGGGLVLVVPVAVAVAGAQLVSRLSTTPGRLRL